MSTGQLINRWAVIAGVTILLAGCSFSQSKSKKLLRAAEDQTFDVIIVPGIPLEDGEWGRIMKARVYWAKYLYEKGITRNVMFSGSAVHSPYYESKVMALYAEAVGIPKENIFVETKAEHSVENIYYSYKKARKLGFKKIALATDPFQSKMTRGFVRKKVSRDIHLLPFVFDTLKMLEPQMTNPEINFETARASSDFQPLKERKNFWQRLRGTRGKSMEKEPY
ncbi:YdcF family protein [Nostoc ellipsosporum NOK]|jgi:uncharacterized SAM-binding protein YcdF (DUF218 family)|nr:YdcF family protein [Nostoc ellipsosporum NOK]